VAGLIHQACLELPSLHSPLGPTHLTQALIDPSAELDRQAFLGAGFRILARLSYLERPLRDPSRQGRLWPAGVRMETYRPGLHDVLLEILEASYEQTRDCPGLRGVRRTADILAGHMATGKFDPDLWTLLWLDGRPAGALLMNPSTRGGSVELAYLGLALFARGRGLGRQLLRHGLEQLRQRHERALVLAVDESNEPALRIYRDEGFRRILRRVALIRPLPA
jgi:GNAT superfamily N-acetyltransferase